MRRTRLQSPLNILKKRLAKGEITKEEYYERKRILEEKEQK
jgi:putative membrane protein